MVECSGSRSKRRPPEGPLGSTSMEVRRRACRRGGGGGEGGGGGGAYLLPSPLSALGVNPFFFVFYVVALLLLPVVGSIGLGNALIKEDVDFDIKEVVPRLVRESWQPRIVQGSGIPTSGFEQSKDTVPSRYCDGRRAGMYTVPSTKNCSSAHICSGQGQGYYLECNSESSERQMVSFIDGEFKCGRTCAAWHMGTVDPSNERRVLQSGTCSVEYSKVNLENVKRDCESGNQTTCCRSMNWALEELIMANVKVMGEAIVKQPLLATCLNDFMAKLKELNVTGPKDCIRLGEKISSEGTSCLGNTKEEIVSAIDSAQLNGGVCNKLEERCKCFDRMNTALSVIRKNNAWNNETRENCISVLTRELLMLNPENIVGVLNLYNCKGVRPIARECPIAFDGVKVRNANLSCQSSDSHCCEDLLNIDKYGARRHPLAASLIVLNRTLTPQNVTLEESCQYLVGTLVFPKGIPQDVSKVCPNYFRPYWDWLDNVSASNCSASNAAINTELNKSKLLPPDSSCRADDMPCTKCAKPLEQAAVSLAGSQSGLVLPCLKKLVLWLLQTDPPSIAGLMRLNITDCKEESPRNPAQDTGGAEQESMRRLASHLRLSTSTVKWEDASVCKWQGVSCSGNNITELDVGGNPLGGKLSADLGYVRSLRKLNLSGTEISGPIPHEIGDLEHLQVLDLSGNRLSGGLPKTFANCKNLSIVDVSGNQLSGDIPDNFASLQAFRYEGSDMDLCSTSENKNLKRCGKRSKLEWPIILMIVLSSAAFILLVVAAVICFLWRRKKKTAPAQGGRGGSIRMGPNPTPAWPSDVQQAATVQQQTPVDSEPSMTPSQSLEGQPPFLQPAVGHPVPAQFRGPPARPPWYREDDRTDSRQPSPQMAFGMPPASVIPQPTSAPPRPEHHSQLVAIQPRSAGVTSQAGSLSTEEQAIMTVNVYTEAEIQEATNSFNRRNILGKGAQGRAYRAKIANRAVVVKICDQGPSAASRFDDVIFIGYVDKLYKLHHPNLVEVLGACVTSKEQMVVYAAMKDGSLYHHLHGRSSPVLSWKARCQVAIAVARGLTYMHEGSPSQMLHRNLKSNNIFIVKPQPPTVDWSAVVGDYGIVMEQLAQEGDPMTTTMTITMEQNSGYNDSECFGLRTYSSVNDVHNFGVVLLELVTGRRPFDSKSHPAQLCAWVQDNVRHLQGGLHGVDAIADPRLVSTERTLPRRQILDMINLAMDCTKIPSAARPHISQVLSTLVEIDNSAGSASLQSALILPEPTFVADEDIPAVILPR